MDRKLIAVAVAGALALPMAAQLQADEMKVEPHSHSATYGHEHAMEDGSMSPPHAHEHESHPHSELHGHDFSVSGHIARIIQHVDGDGEAMDGPKWSHKDAGVSGSRFRITGNKDLENGVTVGVNLEYAAGAGGKSPTVRHSALNFSGGFGSIAFGHTGPTTNSTNDDLSASNLAVDMACSDAAKGDTGRKDSDKKAIVRSKSVCTDFTAGRRGVVKYTTPAIGALGVSGSVAKDFADAQVTASGELGGGSYALRVSFANSGDKADGLDNERELREGGAYAGDTLSAAAAFKVGGVSVSTLWGTVNPDGKDSDGSEYKDIDGFGAKLGYDFGNSGVGVVYRQLEIEDSKSEPSTWGLGVQHNMGAVEFWAGYYVTDHDMDKFDDTSTFNVGSRIKF